MCEVKHDTYSTEKEIHVAELRKRQSEFGKGMLKMSENVGYVSVPGCNVHNGSY